MAFSTKDKQREHYRERRNTSLGDTLASAPDDASLSRACKHISIRIADVSALPKLHAMPGMPETFEVSAGRETWISLYRHTMTAGQLRAVQAMPEVLEIRSFIARERDNGI